VSERALLTRLCRGPATVRELAGELSMDESAVRAGFDRLREAGVAIVNGDALAFTLANPVQLIDREEILAAMPAASRAQVESIFVAFETSSTQADALAAPTPQRGCAVFLAERQTAGQGRRGRAWASPLAANLYMSISRRFAVGLAGLSGLSLVVGVAVAESLNAQLCRAHGETSDDSNAIRIGVKWPNDLVAEGKKLGGILVQVRSDAVAGTQAVIGIGLNVHMPESHAAQIDQAWCDLSGLGGGMLSRNTLVAALLDALLPALEQFEHEGLPPFLPRWRLLDALAGKPVRILDGPAVHEGVSLGITESGALRVRQGEQECSFHSGDVSLRPA
jgi:BirA family biotin operon repressor/biotin-[acetyl-CoA-carboxylase] ligase